MKNATIGNELKLRLNIFIGWLVIAGAFGIVILPGEDHLLVRFG